MSAATQLLPNCHSALNSPPALKRANTRPAVEPTLARGVFYSDMISARLRGDRAREPDIALAVGVDPQLEVDAAKGHRSKSDTWVLASTDRNRRILFSNGSYVDGPLASVFISAVNGWRPSVICPACWRGLGPLALMKSDDPRLPIKGASFGLLTHCGVSDGLRSSRRVVHHVVVALAKLLSLRSPFECVAPD